MGIEKRRAKRVDVNAVIMVNIHIMKIVRRLM